jgi:aminoglycoside 6-adenylyltransferase
MQFMDGNRIDLTLVTREFFANSERDSLSVLLLDKEGILPTFPPPDERDYLPRPPSALDFFNCCNEFWWVCPYVAKGLWRNEILYAKHMHDEVVREQLMKMLTWYIGVKTNFKINPGKNGKYFKQYLEPDLWESLQRTYANADYEATWEALFTMCALFRKIALPVASHFQYDYPEQEDQRVTTYLENLRRSSKNSSDCL